MKKLVTFFICFILSTNSKAQFPALQWVKSIGDTSFEVPHSMVLDKYNNVYTVGSFRGILDFDPGTQTTTLNAIGDDDLFINVLDAVGNFVWARQITTYAATIMSSIALDSLGNIYVAGTFSGIVDFDPGVGVTNLTSNANDLDIFALKLDPQGNFIWAKQMGGQFYDYPQNMKTDAAGNLYITGYFTDVADFDPGSNVLNLNSAGFYDAFIVKLNTLGALVWAKKIGGSMDDYGASITPDTFGNVYVTGVFRDTVDFDPGINVFNLTAASDDVFILKLDPSGNFIWAKNIVGNSYDYSNDIIIDNAGDVCVLGVISAVADLDPGVNVYSLTPQTSYGNAYILKLDPSGNFIWAKLLNGTYSCALDMAVDGSDNIYTVGAFDGTVDFDPGSGTFNQTTVGAGDIFISKLDAGGNFVWVKQFGDSLLDQGRTIAIDNNENIFSTGIYTGIVDLDPNVGIFNLSSAGYNDFYIQKLVQNTNSLKENNYKNSLLIYPNPTSCVINIESENLSTENIKTQLLNSLGQILLEENIDLSHSYINIQHFPDGIYILKIISEGKMISTQKIIKE